MLKIPDDFEIDNQNYNFKGTSDASFQRVIFFVFFNSLKILFKINENVFKVFFI